MKILMVNKFLYHRGGSESYMLELSEELVRMGNQVIFFGMMDEKNVVGRSEYGVRHVDFHVRSWRQILYPVQIIWSHDAAKKIRQLIAVEKPDIVHLNNFNFQITPSILPVIRKAGIPIVMTLHDAQLICPNHSLYSFLEKKSCEACLGHRYWNCVAKKCIHLSRVKSLIGAMEATFHLLARSYRYIDRFVSPSRALREVFIRFGYDAGSIVTMMNFATICSDPPRVGEKHDVLFFGRLAYEKGIPLILRFAAEHPELRVAIAGSGPLEEEVRRNPHVLFLGFKTGEDLKSLIAGASLVIYPSVWFENCPMSILEALALGTPVVGSRSGGVVDLLDDGKCGVLVDPGNYEEMSEAVLALLSDPERRETISRAGRKHAERLTIESYAESILELYHDVVK